VDVRDAVGKQPLVADTIQTHLKLVLDGSTQAQERCHLSVNVNLVHVDAAKDDALTLRPPPSSDFNLFGVRSVLLRFVGGTLSERVSSKPLVLIAIQCHLAAVIILENMTVHVVAVVVLEADGCLVAQVVSEKTLCAGSLPKVLLQADG